MSRAVTLLGQAAWKTGTRTQQTARVAARALPFARPVDPFEGATLMRVGCMRFASTTNPSTASRPIKRALGVAGKAALIGLPIAFVAAMEYDRYRFAKQHELWRLPTAGFMSTDVELIEKQIDVSPLQQQFELDAFQKRLLALLIANKLRQDHQQNQADSGSTYRYMWQAEEQEVAAYVEAIGVTYRALVLNEYKGVLDSAKLVNVAFKLVKHDIESLESALQKLNALKQGKPSNTYSRVSVGLPNSWDELLDVIINTDHENLPRDWNTASTNYKALTNMQLHLNTKHDLGLTVEQVNQLNICAYDKLSNSRSALPKAISFLLNEGGLKWAEVVERVNDAAELGVQSDKLLEQVNAIKVCQLLGAPLGSLNMDGVYWEPKGWGVEAHYENIEYLVKQAGFKPQDAIDAIASRDRSIGALERSGGTPNEISEVGHQYRWPQYIERMKGGMPLEEAKQCTDDQFWASGYAERMIDQGKLTLKQFEEAGQVKHNPSTGKPYISFDAEVARLTEIYCGNDCVPPSDSEIERGLKQDVLPKVMSRIHLVKDGMPFTEALCYSDQQNIVHKCAIRLMPGKFDLSRLVQAGQAKRNADTGLTHVYIDKAFATSVNEELGSVDLDKATDDAIEAAFESTLEKLSSSSTMRP